MKKLLSFVLICSFPIFVAGQNWAPIGATWYYEIVYPFSPQLSFIKYESVADTNILGKTCKIITVTDGITGYGYLVGNSDTAFTYEDNRKIYVFDPINNGFSLVYDFAADSGSTWITTWDTCNYERIINSTDSILIIGFIVKTLSFGGLKILEGIGGERTLFHGLGPVECEPPDTIIVDLPFIQRLRCYEDSILGLYNTGVSTTCDYVTTRINDINEQNNWVSIYPNPASSEINIEVKNRQGKNFFFSLVTIMGEKIITIKSDKE
nr:hypothetical protein [Bacteroidota bacterium]